MKRTSPLIILLTLVINFLLPANQVLAAEFDPHLIITDTDLTANDTMSVTDIQRFLNEQKSGLRSLSFTDTDGTKKTAAEIIFAAAQESQINPRYILVSLQKEQSLILAANPTQKQLDWATGFGVCDSCSMDDPAIQKFKGFANQVRRSASIMRYYYDNVQQQWIKRSGQTYLIDSISVTPKSYATAFLYTYTPHINGNKNFWRIWNQWFTKVYPDGTLVQLIDDKVVYLLQQGKRRPFASMAALVSRFNPDLIVKIAPADVSAYEVGQPISLPNYSLVKGSSSMTYLIIDETKHPIASAAVFKTIGFNPDEVVDVSDTELASFKDGTFITTASVYPLGAVVREKKSKQLYYIKNGLRSVIPSEEIAQVNFGKKKIVTLNAAQIAQYPLQPEAVLFKDGTLLAVKGQAFVYVMSNGQRRLIPTEAMFKNLGYQWKNIVYTTENGLTAIPEGAPLSDVPAVSTALAAR